MICTPGRRWAGAPERLHQYLVRVAASVQAAAGVGRRDQVTADAARHPGCLAVRGRATSCLGRHLPRGR